MIITTTFNRSADKYRKGWIVRKDNKCYLISVNNTTEGNKNSQKHESVGP